MIFFTSDLHFGHKNIIRHCNRNFVDVQEMDATLMRNWNDTVQYDDEVYILGDFSSEPANKVHSILNRLNGMKYLIKGNHDRFLSNYEKYSSDFVWIKDYAVIEFENRKFVLFHYPILEWDGYYGGAIHCHGHIHTHLAAQGSLDNLRAKQKCNTSNRLPGLCVNVGTDVNQLKPISIYDTIKQAELNARLKSHFA